MSTEVVATSTQQRLARFKSMWDGALPIISKIVPKHVDPAQVFSICVTARQRDPRLIECTDVSVLRAAILSAQFGLDCSGIGGKAYMIPYWNKDVVVDGRKGANEAHFQFGWRGLQELAMRTGKIAAIFSRPVYEGEKFEYVDGLQQVLVHQPSAEEGREVVAAWAVAVHNNGFRQPEVMWRHQIEARRQVSRAADGPAWKNWYPEMATKTVTRLLCKKLPDSPELARALDVEDRADLGLLPTQEIELEALTEGEVEPPPTRTEKLKNTIAGKKSRKEQAEEPEPPSDEPPQDSLDYEDQ